MNETASYRYEQASVLYSGGTDSTLAGVEMLKLARKVTLLTFDPGFLFFVENSRVLAEALAESFGGDRVRHEIIPIREVTREVLFGDTKGDLRRYGFDMTALVCMGCRLSMHTRAIIYNLEHGIALLADGSIRKQDAIPEQRQSVLETNRALYLERYGVRQLSPIYAESHSDERLYEAGITRARKLKKQFIFFETQSTCPFGVTADVYARMFYKPLMGPSTNQQSLEYCGSKYSAMHGVIERYFHERGQDLGALVKRLREQHAQAGDEVAARAH